MILSSLDENLSMDTDIKTKEFEIPFFGPGSIIGENCVVWIWDFISLYRCIYRISKTNFERK